MNRVGYKSLALGCVLSLLGGHAVAGGTVTGTTITHIEAEPNGHFFFYLAKNISSSPACALQPATGFVVDGTTAAGRIIVSLVQTAYSLGKTVNVAGPGTCSVHAGYEDVSDVYTTN